MSEENKKPKLVFAPGCFDNFDGSQEELDEMIAEIQRLIDSGEIFEKSTPIDLDEILEDLSEEEFESLFNDVDESTTNRKLH